MNSLTEAIKALPVGLTRREVGETEKELLQSLAQPV